MKLILQTALTGAGAMSFLMQYVAGRDTETGRSLRIAASVFLLAGTVMNILWLLLDREDNNGRHAEEEL